ncbi:hypothetical protein QLX08_010969 [Tetragonisca angustula]|uniref:Uncharacterized protein n=1 Tax=Tetragonisca angustula TaxID=166442 RepID=A0AAW0ZA93_9HYME
MESRIVAKSCEKKHRSVAGCLRRSLFRHVRRILANANVFARNVHLNVTFAFYTKNERTKRTNTLRINKTSARNENPQTAKRIRRPKRENDGEKGVREHTGTICPVFK